MYSGKEMKKNSPSNLKLFLKELLDEQEKEVSIIAEEKKDLFNTLNEKKTLVQILNKDMEKNVNIFSPNSIDYNIDDYLTDLKSLEKQIEEINNKQSKFETSILYLGDIYNLIDDKNRPQYNMDINILEIQEKDRQRIARDLHDSTIQSLTSLIHKSELCFRLVDIDPVRTRLELSTISNTIKSIINEIREIVFDFKPMSLEDLGLVSTVERYTHQLTMCHDINIKINHNEGKENLLPIINLSAFRLIQEACNNAIKHAEAENINIDIKYSKHNIKLLIKDDGKGFDTKDLTYCIANDNCGYGLSIMKERVNLLSGTMNIQSKINVGTKITITIPITKSEGEE